MVLKLQIENKIINHILFILLLSNSNFLKTNSLTELRILIKEFKLNFFKHINSKSSRPQ